VQFSRSQFPARFRRVIVSRPSPFPPERKAISQARAPGLINLNDLRSPLFLFQRSSASLAQVAIKRSRNRRGRSYVRQSNVSAYLAGIYCSFSRVLAGAPSIAICDSLGILIHDLRPPLEYCSAKRRPSEIRFFLVVIIVIIARPRVVVFELDEARWNSGGPTRKWQFLS